jgi:gamma-glutamyltranspeptidase/glutathione hydrolase
MKRNSIRMALICAALLAVPVGAQGAGAQEPAKTPTATGSGGAAATVDALGTQAAIETMRAGGNAVDAAVASWSSARPAAR